MLKRFARDDNATKCKRLKRIISIYFRAMKWTVEWSAAKPPREGLAAFALNREDLEGLGIDTVTDCLREWGSQRSSPVSHLTWRHGPEASELVGSMMFDEAAGVRVSANRYVKGPPRDAVVDHVWFKAGPEFPPWWTIRGAMHDCTAAVEPLLQVAGVPPWRGLPLFKHLEDGQELLDYMAARRVSTEAIGCELTEQMRAYTADLSATIRHAQRAPAATVEPRAAGGSGGSGAAAEALDNAQLPPASTNAAVAGGGARKARRTGRPKASAADIAADAKLCADWESAYASGVGTFEDFARLRGFDSWKGRDGKPIGVVRAGKEVGKVVGRHRKR